MGEKTFTPPEISALILRQLKKNAEAALGSTVSKAVITVPAYFNDAQRQATRDAGRIAGLEVLRLVNEPTAAALAYGLDKRKEGVIAVYDLGGGTFDISILKLHDGIFEVLATNGDTHLGGDDIDNRLLRIALEDLQSEWGEDLSQIGEAVQTLRRDVIRAKEALSFAPAATIEFDWQGKHYRARDHARTVRKPDPRHRGPDAGPVPRLHAGRGRDAGADRRSGAGGRLDAHSAGAQRGGSAVPRQAPYRTESG